MGKSTLVLIALAALGLGALIQLLAVAVSGPGVDSSNQAFAQEAGNWKNVSL